MSNSWTLVCLTTRHSCVLPLDTGVSSSYTLGFEFSPRKRRKRARTLATFATRKLLARGLAAATQFASLTRPDRFAAGASCSSVNLTPSAQANLRDTCAEDERSESEGSRADRRSSARAKRSGLKAPRNGHEDSLRTIRP